MVRVAGVYAVVSMARVPLPPVVVMMPFEVRLESVVMFCEVFTVKAPEVYESHVPAVVVEVQVGTPETSARTWPFVPAEVVASLFVPFPRRTVLAVMFPHPVPPFAMARIPETSEARLTSAVESTPAVALRKPVSEVETVPSEGALVSVPMVEVALMRASVLALVKYKLDPSASAVVVVPAIMEATVLVKSEMVDAS